MSIDRWIEGAPERWIEGVPEPGGRGSAERIRAGEQAELEFDQGKEMSRRRDDARAIAELRQLLREALLDHTHEHGSFRCSRPEGASCACGLDDWRERAGRLLGEETA